MKKGLMVITLIAMSALLLNAFAFTYEDRGPDGNYGNGPKTHHTKFKGQGCWNSDGESPEIVINSENDARNAVENYINENLKGYRIGTVTKAETHRGMDMYFVTATDASNNTFTFITHPFGGVKGPISGDIDPAKRPVRR